MLVATLILQMQEDVCMGRASRRGARAVLVLETGTLPVEYLPSDGKTVAAISFVFIIETFLPSPASAKGLQSRPAIPMHLQLNLTFFIFMNTSEFHK